MKPLPISLDLAVALRFKSEERRKQRMANGKKDDRSELKDLKKVIEKRPIIIDLKFQKPWWAL